MLPLRLDLAAFCPEAARTWYPVAPPAEALAMATLVLATSGPHGEVGLEIAPGDLHVRALGEGAARGRGLLVAVDALVERAGRTPAAIEAVVCDQGPGSFTGVRVGVTTANALALALGVPARGVTSLEALARAAPDERTVLAVRDAGRGGIYAARYAPRAGGRRRLLEGPWRRPAVEVFRQAKGALVVGEEATLLIERAGVGGVEALDLRAGAEAILAAARDAAASGDAPPAGVVAPLYLQVSAPERRRAGEPEGRATGGAADNRPS